MVEAWTQNSIYKNSVSPAKRESLLAAYREYISLVSNLEDVVKRCQIGRIADAGAKAIYGEKNPWCAEVLHPEDKQAYEDFLANKPTESNHNCYISLNHTSAQYAGEGQGIISAPSTYNVRSGNNALPHRVERYVIAYPKEEKLSSSRFIIEGKYVVTYKDTDKNKTIDEAYANDSFEQKMMCILDVFAQIPATGKIENKDIVYMQTEAMASFKVAPFESMILDTLSLLAEETHKIIKELVGRRVGNNYLSQAEKEGLLTSGSKLQEFLNIRHLMYHQWDTLDGIGKFNNSETIKNASVRRRYLDSYCNLCDMPLAQRVESYKSAAEIFLPLVQILNDNFLAKNKTESDSRFFQKIEEYVALKGDNGLYIETGYDHSDKKDTTIENLEKKYPNIKVIDKAGMDMADMGERINSYLVRRQYVDWFQHIEYMVCQHCLFCGKNYTPVIAWDYIKRQHIISTEEAEKWMEYKRLRNDLSHKYMDNELNAHVADMLSNLQQDCLTLKERIEARTPSVQLVQDNIYRATHENGMVVDIDFSSQRVLSVTNAAGYTKRPVFDNNQNGRKIRPYTEEYQNGNSITITDMDITACRLNNGIEADFEKKRIQYQNGIQIYFENPEKMYMTAKTGDKIFADKYFTILSYISHGKAVSLGKKEILSIQNNHQLVTGNGGRIVAESWINGKGNKIQSNWIKTANGCQIEYNDGTKIEIEKGLAKIFHNGIELNYANRKEFAQSYNENTVKGNILGAGGPER